MHTSSLMYTMCCCILFRIMDSLSGMAVFFVRALERASIKDRETARPAPSIKRSLIGIASFFPTRNIRANLSSRTLFAPVFFIFRILLYSVAGEKYRRLERNTKKNEITRVWRIGAMCWWIRVKAQSLDNLRPRRSSSSQSNINNKTMTVKIGAIFERVRVKRSVQKL